MNYRLADGVVMEHVGETCVFLKDNGDAAVPNRIGGVMIRQLLTGGVQPCVEHVLENYEADAEVVKTDIEEFVEELEAQGLVRGFDGQ